MNKTGRGLLPPACENSHKKGAVAMTAKKNEVYPLRMEGYGSSGEGVARLNGQAVFVKGALAGELCRVQLLKVGKSAAWGRCVF